MGYRRFRRPLPLVARRPSLVARPTVDRQPLTEIPSCRTADGDRRSSLGVSKSRYAYCLLTYLPYLTYLTCLLTLQTHFHGFLPKWMPFRKEKQAIVDR